MPWLASARQHEVGQAVATQRGDPGAATRVALQAETAPERTDMSTPGFPQDADEAVKRVKELSDRAIELAQQNGIAWVEAYEKVLEQMINLQQRAAASTQIDWINDLTSANAAFMREMSSVDFRTVREQLK